MMLQAYVSSSAVHLPRRRLSFGTTSPPLLPALFACGELVGGVFFNGYPGGSGLTSGAVFGRIAGYGAAK